MCDLKNLMYGYIEQQYDETIVKICMRNAESARILQIVFNTWFFLAAKLEFIF